jgi:mannose-6-phosphate isomerase-like protein (cupin superfamily)
MSNYTLVRAADAEVLPASGITLLADAAGNGGVLTSNRSFMAAGTDGAPPHFHRGAAELFFVLNGTLDVLLGEEIVTVTANDLLVVPAGLPHAFAPAKDAAADVLFVYTPSKPRFDYYRLLEPCTPATRTRRSWRTRRTATTTTTSTARCGPPADPIGLVTVAQPGYPRRFRVPSPGQVGGT